MKRILTLIFVAVFAICYGCNDNYDDSALWKDIDGMYKSLNELRTQVSTMQKQLEALNAILAGGAITGVAQNAEGHYVISYKDAQHVERSFTVATMSEANTQPIIGMQIDKEVYYWTTTVKNKTSWLLDVDGEKVPVTGRTPELGVDKDGYWTVFGKRITDTAGQPVRAEGKTASVITGIKMKDDSTAVITLGGGVEVTVQVQSGFNVRFIDTQTTTIIEQTATPLVIHYELVGATETSVLSIERADHLTAVLDTMAKTITVTFPADFEMGSIIVLFYDGEDHVILKPLEFMTKDATPTGICTADDLKAFAAAVNQGRSLTKYTIEGEIRLMNDIDLTGVDWNDLCIGGKVTANTVAANTAVTYTPGEYAFSKVFNGGGYALKNIAWKLNLGDGNISHGLFSALGAAGEIRNLTLEGAISVEGVAPQGALIGAFAGYSAGKITSCINKTAIAFAGTDAKDISVRIGGIAGCAKSGTIASCRNEGVMTCGVIVNTNSGANSGFHQGGIVGAADGASLEACENNASLSAPSGRGGGIAGVATAGMLFKCVNNGVVQDDVNGVFGGPNPGYKRMGGLVGATTANVTLSECVNAGNVFSQLGCRSGGFVGHNEGTILQCENKGVILSDHTKDGTNYHGSGWAAGYNKAADLIAKCVIGGRVGDYKDFKNNPAGAPEATYAMAVVHGSFDKQANGLDQNMMEFYDWTLKEEVTLGAGVKYSHYSLNNFKQNIYVLEADLTNPKVVIETAMADEIAPNPNANKNANNGKNLRETCSETCTRRRVEGRNVVAGINSGFFDSNDGFPRGCHIEYGEPVFVNNPTVRASLTNHHPGFTLFGDRTVSFGMRTFKGEFKAGGRTYEYFSINDTIVRLNKTDGFEANLYTSRFAKSPHPGISNPVGKKALFIVCRNTSTPLTVNNGYFDAQVTAVVDGRSGAAVEVPFVTDKNAWVLQLTGVMAQELASVKVGDPVQIRADFTVGNAAKSVITHNSSMYRFLNEGLWGDVKINDDELMPATCIGATQDGGKVMLVCIDGRTAEDAGMNYRQLYMTMKKLGLHNAVRFDGGGSTTMWKYAAGAGTVANHPCDSKGERSCMNYLHVRILE